MLLIDRSFSTPNENLAFDEALVEAADEATTLGGDAVESLRLWEFTSWTVVQGRGSKPEEVHLQVCRAEGVPVFQRCSGGASIVAGPGCLMYSLLLSLESQPRLREVDYAHRFVMQKILVAIQSLSIPVRLDGTCDLTLHGRKCSGNALRYKRHWLLYHGTLLYAFDIARIERYLAMPPRQPNYRSARSHVDFLINVPSEKSDLKQALVSTWQAEEAWEIRPFARSLLAKTKQLLETKYR